MVFLIAPKDYFAVGIFIASGFQSIVLALFQFNDDAFKEKVFSLNLIN